LDAVIQVTCTHCRQTLSLDDGFAGGAFRCQFCGTIQTVPAAANADPMQSRTPAKTLYRNQGRRSDDSVAGWHAGSGSGLDQFADLSGSSGLSHSARSLPSADPNPVDDVAGKPAPAPPAGSSAHPHQTLIWIAGALLLLILLLIALWLHGVISFHRSVFIPNVAPSVTSPRPPPQPPH
jgi:hypothetical protein